MSCYISSSYDNDIFYIQMTSPLVYTKGLTIDFIKPTFNLRVNKGIKEINKFELYKKQIKKYWNQNLLVNIGDENYLFVNKLLNNEININSIELFDIKLIKRNQYNPIIN